MARRKREEEQKLADDLEREAQVADAWEDAPAPTPRTTLGTVVSVRLDEKQAAILRRIAQARGVGYTSLVREWINEQLIDEQRIAALLTPVVSQVDREPGPDPVREYSTSGVRRSSFAVS